jgi:hypothetical protein
LYQFNLHPSWRVVAGGESKEVAVQRQREVRVLEAVYPRPSSIPERYLPSLLIPVTALHIFSEVKVSLLM